MWFKFIFKLLKYRPPTFLRYGCLCFGTVRSSGNKLDKVVVKVQIVNMSANGTMALLCPSF